MTHGGEKLTDIDKFDNPNSDIEEDDEDEKLLSKDFVDEAHFGGFMTKADDDFKAGKGNNRKEYIENLIRESKKKKAEKRKAEEEAEEKTLELDSNWKSLLRDMQEGGLMGKKEEQAPANYDPYDMLVKSLSFQKKEAVAGERLKTEEEKFKEEKERLQKLEEDRQRRMRGETETSARTLQSVEALEDDDIGTKKISRKERRRLEKVEKRLQQQENGSDDDEDEKEEEMEGEADEEGSEDEEDSDEGEDDDNSDLDESDEDKEEEFNIDDYNEKDVFDEKMVAMMEQASKEIPYIILVHDSYESFSALVWDR